LISLISVMVRASGSSARAPISVISSPTIKFS
jgi:hypothetical protein